MDDPFFSLSGDSPPNSKPTMVDEWGDEVITVIGIDLIL